MPFRATHKLVHPDHTPVAAMRYGEVWWTEINWEKRQRGYAHKWVSDIALYGKGWRPVPITRRPKP